MTGVRLTPEERVAWLRLIRTDNVGPITFHRLIGRAGSAQDAIADLPMLAKRAGVGARVPSVMEAEEEIARLEQLGGRMVGMGEPDYPPLLAHAEGAPPLISVLGGISLDLARSVAMVGARNASAAGRSFTQVLAAGLGDAGFVVVSGLARGIDTAAHKASLKTGTVAVLAGGVDHIYPDENVPLSREILANGGQLISEMPLGYAPRAQDFPRRNRIVSAIALGVVVVEAAKRSGSLITARYALEQNREVFAVPGSPLDPRAEGGNHLIKEGAHLVTSADDIVNVLGAAQQMGGRFLEPQLDFAPTIAPDVEIGSADLAILTEALSHTPTHVDVLVNSTGLSVSAVQTLLLELDIGGRIEWSSGQLVALKS